MRVCCPSIYLVCDKALARAEVLERVPIDAYGKNEDGRLVAVLLHVVDGYLAELEVYSLQGDEVFGLPRLDTLEVTGWDGLAD